MVEQYFYSSLTGGFYCESVHGSLQVSIPDPDWIRPMVAVADPDWVRPMVAVNNPDYDPEDPGAVPEFIDVPDESAEAPLVDVSDEAAEHPAIVIDNVDCKIPDEAKTVVVDAVSRAALSEAESLGKVIEADVDGYPVAVDPPAPAFEDAKLTALRALDVSAGEARARFISDGEGILQEYDRAYSVAIAFRDASYAGGVPAAVAANMRYKAMTALQAADDIIAEGDALNTVLDAIRDQRLDGKLAVKGAVEGGDVGVIVQPFLDALAAIKPA